MTGQKPVSLNDCADFHGGVILYAKTGNVV